MSKTQATQTKLNPVALRDLNRILARSLKELGELGASQKACELAAEAWTVLREVEPKEAERMNGLLHQLTNTRCSKADSKSQSELQSQTQIQSMTRSETQSQTPLHSQEKAESETSSRVQSRSQEGKDESKAVDFDLEVRHLVPAQRHELIIETYHKLQPGQGFVLINDHDPKPLYYQFSFEYPDAFTWTPIESGPEVWRVRIGKP